MPYGRYKNPGLSIKKTSSWWQRPSGAELIAGDFSCVLDLAPPAIFVLY